MPIFAKDFRPKQAKPQHTNMQLIMKKIQLLFAVIFTAFIAHTASAYDFCVDGVYYRLMDDGSSVAVTGEGANYEPYVYVPDQVSFGGKSYDVVRIDDLAFLEYMDGRSIRCISLGSITEIGAHAFGQYANAWELIIPKIIFRTSEAPCDFNKWAFSSSETFILVPLGSEASYQARGWNHTIQNDDIWEKLSTIAYNPDLFSSERINEMDLYFENDHLKYNANTLDASCKATVRGYLDSEEDIIIPDQVVNDTYIYKVSEIAASALSNSQARSLTLCSTLETINEKAFNAMPNLTKIICPISEPFPIPTDAFGAITYQTATLYVPVGRINDYYAAEGWNKFAQIREIGDDGTGEPQMPQCERPTLSYYDGQLQFTCSTPSAQFVYSIGSDIQTGSTLSESGTVAINPTFHISVYAIADGYASSETVTATLSFSSGTLTIHDQDNHLTSPTISSVAPASTFTLSGFPVTEGEHGMFILKMEDGTTRKVWRE